MQNSFITLAFPVIMIVTTALETGARKYQRQAAIPGAVVHSVLPKERVSMRLDCQSRTN